MPHILTRLLDQRGVLLADGATGSNLFAVGLQTGGCPELWNAVHPERIAQQYRDFIDAGSDIILTNSFGGTRYRLQRHDAEDRVAELNIKAARIARQQVDACGREIIIGGSVGPTGEIMQPLGPLAAAAATEAFAEQALALKQGGVDVIWIETMSSKEEAEAAVSGAARAELPIVATFSVDTNGRTMMGLAPADIVKICYAMERIPDAIGANCGVGASELVAAVINMRHAAQVQQVTPLVVAKANCGIPQYVDGDIVYSGTQAVMSEYVKLATDAGANIIGGCCGTTAAHIKAMRAAIDAHRVQPVPTLTQIEGRLGAVSAGAKAQLRGEMEIAAGALTERKPRARARRRAS